jgi:hypothetical protein
MTTSDPRVLDLTTYDSPQSRHGRPHGSDLHLLRLTLDLQLDAMLLTLGAAAHAESRGDDVEGGVPWRRWLVEDLELARTLAAVLLEGEAAPVPGLGGGFSNSTIDTSLENLAARYASMEDLLGSLLERPQQGQPWRAAAAQALCHCRARLDELHGHRREMLSTVAGRTSFLPGELLG